MPTADNNHYVNFGPRNAPIHADNKGFPVSDIGYHKRETVTAPKILRFAYDIGVHTYVLPGQTGRPPAAWAHPPPGIWASRLPHVVEIPKSDFSFHMLDFFKTPRISQLGAKR